MKIGSFTWAMEQVIAGKKVTRSNYRNKDYHIKLNDDGDIVIHTNTGCNFDFSDTSATDWIIWSPPINYPVGTFPWAVEQMKQGKVLRHGHLKYRFDGECFQELSDDINWYEVVFDTSEILATKWEIA